MRFVAKDWHFSQVNSSVRKKEHLMNRKPNENTQLLVNFVKRTHFKCLPLSSFTQNNTHFLQHLLRYFCHLCPNIVGQFFQHSLLVCIHFRLQVVPQRSIRPTVERGDHGNEVRPKITRSPNTAQIASIKTLGVWRCPVKTG